MWMSLQDPARQKPAQPAAGPNPQEANPLLKEESQPTTAQANPEISPSPAATDSFPERLITLGSMDPAKKYNLLITLTSQGAGIQRAELVGRFDTGDKLRFVALEHNHGYLGYLGLSEAIEPMGLKIRVVPDGSPAAVATCADADVGLQVDDVITQVDDSPLSSVDDLNNWLSKKKPGQSVTIQVQRAERPLSYQCTLSQTPLDILRTEPFASEVVPGNQELTSLRTTLASINATKIPIGKSSLPALAPVFQQNWQVGSLEVPGGSGVEFRMPLQQMLSSTEFANLELVKRYRLLPKGPDHDGYLLDLETLVVNNNQQPVSVAVRQEGLTGLSLEGWWYSVKISQSFFSSAGHRDVAFGDGSGVHHLKSTRDIHSAASKTPEQPHTILFSEGEPLERRSLNYIGVDSQYFNASLLPHPASPESLKDLARAGAWAVGDWQTINKSQIQATNVAFWLESREQPIAAGQSLANRYSIFLGPKDANVLANHGLDLTIEYGWFPWVAKPLGWLLHFFYAIVRNYGIAIIMLTVCVRLLLFPLGRRAAIAGQRMQELQPEMKKINEMYPDNMEKRAKAMQELYRKYDFKPLAGCLPLFIQLPIFIGLYRCLSVDISLRQEGLIPGLAWCSNLAGPDQLYDWSGWMWEYLAGRGTGWLGPYFNILPMVTVALFLVQQKMLMPKATDPQTQMTQTMMKYMTVFMGVIFFKVPAGLCIYFITSSIWSLIERQLVKRSLPPPGTLAASSNSPTDPAPSGKLKIADRLKPEATADQSSKLDRWRQMLDKPAVRSGTQRGSARRKKKK